MLDAIYSPRSMHKFWPELRQECHFCMDFGICI